MLTKEAWLKLIETMSYDDLEQKLRNAIDPPNAEGIRSYNYWIKETFPGYCVVEFDVDSKIYRVEYTVDAEENVVIGQWQEAEYVLQIKQGGSTSPPAEVVTVTESASQGDITELTTLVEAPADPEGKAFRVTVLRPGWNVTLEGKQGDKYYTRQACASLVPLLANAKAYADHPTKLEEHQRPERSIRDLVGWYTEPRQEVDGRTTAMLNVLESAGWLRSLLKEAPHLAGLSINGFGITKVGTADGRRGKIVESIEVLRSTDVVTESGAGGSVEQLVASKKPGEESEKEVELKDITIDLLRESRPDLVQAIGHERLAEVKTDFQKELDAVKESVSTVDTENKRLRSELAAERVKLTVKGKISDQLLEIKLPEVSRKRLAQLLEARDFTKDGAVDETALKEAVTAAVAEERAYLTQLTESGRIVGMGGGEPPNPVEKASAVQGKLDKMFGVGEPAGK